MVKSVDTYHRKRTKYIALLGGKCEVCGTVDNLEFDHIDPLTKSFPVSEKMTYREEVILPEVMKCQLLCHDHHVEKSQSDGSWKGSWNKGSWKHGTASAYRIGCRCDKCKSAYSIKRREHYKRTNK